MLSPFPYDKISSGDSFFGRDDEMALLAKTVEYSNNLLIYSKRRMGKSSLINRFFEKNKDAALCIYVDIFEITCKEDFAKSLLRGISNAAKGDIKSVVKKLTSLFKRVRVEPSIDPTTFEFTIKPIVATLSFEEMMEDFFHTLEELSQESKVIIAIDEFQQIATITDVKLDAILRKYIQNRKNVSYLFLGSKRHLLTSLFEYQAPLYEMATHFELQALQFDAILDYVIKYLNIDEQQLRYICEITRFETKMMQNVLHLLYLQKQEIVTKERIDEAVNEIINSKESSYKIIFDSMNNNQKIALKVIGKYKNGFFAQTVLQEFNIKKQTLQSALDALFKRELIDKDEDLYFIPDRTLELWVERLI
jgi:AAA+ ATPase superfamily predicted ATPase